MKLFLFTLLFFLYSFEGFAAPNQTVRIKNGQGIIAWLSDLEGPASVIRTVKLDLEFLSDAKDGNSDVSIDFGVIPPSVFSYNVLVVSGGLTIKKEEFTTELKSKKIDVQVQLKVVSTYKDEAFDIVLQRPVGVNLPAVEGGNFHIRIAKEVPEEKKKAEYTNKPFWVEVGSNFDLVDGLEPNNLFGGVFLYDRDIRNLSKKDKKNRNIGLFAGVYESKSSSVASEVYTLRSYFNSASLSLRRNDSFGVFRDTGIISNKQTVRNVSLFFSPQLRLSNGTANDEGLHFFTSAWVELQWQRIAYESDYSALIRLDTIFRPIRELNDINNPGTQKKTVDIKSHYYGIGFPIYFKEDDVNVFLNPVFGISNQPRGEELANLFLQKVADPLGLKDRKWNPFYVFQFRLNEEKYGIAFTGEVRGLLRKNSPPFVSIALTKKFDLSKFIEFQK